MDGFSFQLGKCDPTTINVAVTYPTGKVQQFTLEQLLHGKDGLQIRLDAGGDSPEVQVGLQADMAFTDALIAEVKPLVRAEEIRRLKERITDLEKDIADKTADMKQEVQP